MMLDFFGLLVLGGLVGRVVVQTQSGVRRVLSDATIDLVLVVTVGATLGSLYLSEVVGLVPCELCWFQRIAMYPSAVLLVMARVRSDRTILPYVLVLSTIGLIISLYHVQLQLFPEQSSFCEVANPCTSKAGRAFGWMTIPQMAAGSFALVATTIATSLREHREES